MPATLIMPTPPFEASHLLCRPLFNWISQYLPQLSTGRGAARHQYVDIAYLEYMSGCYQRHAFRIDDDSSSQVGELNLPDGTLRGAQSKLICHFNMRCDDVPARCRQHLANCSTLIVDVRSVIFHCAKTC